MPHFEAVETLLLELPDLSFGAVVAEVCGDGDPADGVHQLGHLLQRRQRLLDVGRSAPAEIARERVVHVDAHATLHENPGHVRATHRSPVRHAHDVRQLDHDAEPAQMPHDLLGTTVSRSPRTGKEFLEPGMTGR